MCQINCAGVNLDCTKLKSFIKRKGASCSLNDLRHSKEMAWVAKQYSDSIGNDALIPLAHYDWFICVIVGSLVLQENVKVGFNPFYLGL